MGVLANLVSQCQPAYYGDGCFAHAVAGTTWSWPFQISDTGGTGINLTGVTITCNVLVDGVLLVALTTSGNSSGLLTVSLTDTASALLATTGTVYAAWSLTLDDGTDTIHVWAAEPSRLTIDEAA